MNNTDQEHLELVTRLLKSGETLREEWSPLDCSLLHVASKLCSEAGELMDAIGKGVFYRQPIDLANVEEELGDIEFYLAAIRRELNISRICTLTGNIAKLNKRYPQGYTDEHAKLRADKQLTSNDHPV